MSDQPPLQPLSSQEPQPIPPVPLPVLPYAQVEAQRPGILTALGVMSIICGGTALLTNLCGISKSAGYIFMSRFSASVAAGPTTIPVIPFSNMPVTPFVIEGIGAALSLALAGYLIACGILVLRDSAAARRHHLRYTVLKFIAVAPVAMAEGWSSYCMQKAMLASMPSSATPDAALFLWMAVGMAAFWFVVSLAYPVAIAIVMHLSQVRGYYDQLGQTPRH